MKTMQSLDLQSHSPMKEMAGDRQSGFWRVQETSINGGIKHPREAQEQEPAFSRMGNKNSRPRGKERDPEIGGVSSASPR